MSEQHAIAQPSTAAGRPPAGEYTVVARRYRPRAFAELIGQEHVARALSGAIESQRVGHAYLFTGARGVGKTSAARILAKALNCERGPTPQPCNECDICHGIGLGDDIDVLEIDGASNRGIDEMRDLRQNVNVRPSRARFKIYIIDEVHMLTREAFNALLKTLEEPPEHVKFIFCTTEAEKIPVTILSRCQRFDFAGIQTASIAARLRQIVTAEGVEAEAEALAALARRAAGSMRDSQSLLEQLLAFGGARVTLDDVHRMLGTAGDRRLGQLVEHLVNRNAGGALAEFDAALADGVDVGSLADQLLGYFRDLMVSAVGCPPEALLYASESERPRVMETGRRLGLETLLAIMQILDQMLARLRYSTQGRILVELALVRICNLEDLDQLAQLIGQLRAGTLAAGDGQSRPAPRRAAPLTAEALKKKSEVSVRLDETAPELEAECLLTPENVEAVWKQVLSRLPNMFAEQASFYASLAIAAPNRLVVSFPKKYTSFKSFCERPEQIARLESELAPLAGRRVRIEFALVDDEPEGEAQPEARRQKFVTPRDRLLEKTDHPLIRRAIELFDAHPVRLEEPEP